jgi:hypothetical protein
MAAAQNNGGVFSAIGMLGLGDAETIGKKGLDFLMNPKWSFYLSWFLLVVDAVLCGLILRTTACTFDVDSAALLLY